ncbi:unnamed protein product [Cunninghamella blakesleeana]
MKSISISLALISCLMFLNNSVHAAPVSNEIANTIPNPIIQLTSEQLAAFEASSDRNDEIVPEGEREKYLKSKNEKEGKDKEKDDPDFDDEDTPGTPAGMDDDEPADLDDEPTTKNQVA